MRRAQRTMKRTKKKTPSGVTKWVTKKRRPNHARCKCGAKLNRARLVPSKIKKLTKTKKRPSRPYPELCVRCMRKKVKTVIK